MYVCMYVCMYVYSGAPLNRTPLGQKSEVSSFESTQMSHLGLEKVRCPQFRLDPEHLCDGPRRN